MVSGRVALASQRRISRRSHTPISFGVLSDAIPIRRLPSASSANQPARSTGEFGVAHVARFPGDASYVV